MKRLQSLNTRLVLAACGLALLAAATPADAADPSIVVGSHNLLPNTAHQPIAIRVAGVSSVGMLSITYTATAIRDDFSADLALVTLSTPTPSAAQLWTAANGSEVGQLFTAAGFGAIDANSDGVWDSLRDNQRRQFANRIDSIPTGSIPGQGQVLRYDFNLTTGQPVSDDEGLPGPGDSGGGLFLWDGQRYLLAGILSSSGSPVDAATASATRLSPFAATLAAIPEPTTLTLLLTLPTLLLRRRLR